MYLEYKTIFKYREGSNRITFFFIILFALLLNQSNYFLGINFSISDIVCILLLIIFIIKSKLTIPAKPLIFFLAVSNVVLFTATFYVPVKYSYDSDFIAVASNYIKMLATFIYFLIGYNLAKYGYSYMVVKWFSLGALLMGIIAFVFTIFNIKLFSNLLYDYGIRFRGLMVDPNYFSILQIGALSYFMVVKNIRNNMRYTAVFFLFVSILISGSKTGVATLIIYLFFKLCDNMINMKFRFQVLILKILILIMLISIFPLIFYKLSDFTNIISGYIPSFNRISTMFIDFINAVSDGGSSRNVTWNTALKMIQSSPLTGIGVGTYLGISSLVWNVNTVAHNTYLQLLVEWGMPLSVTFFIYVFILIAKASFIKATRTECNVIVRDFLFIFLVGSFAISLNNARMFWAFLGMLSYGVKTSDY